MLPGLQRSKVADAMGRGHQWAEALLASPRRTVLHTLVLGLTYVVLDGEHELGSKPAKQTG